MHDTPMKFIQACIIMVMFTVIAQAGYFLSWPQKGELLLTGCVTGDDGNSYNVRILPGYWSNLTFGGDAWVHGWQFQQNGGYQIAHGLIRIPISFKYLGEYVSPAPWKGIGSGFGQMCSGENYLFSEFMWRNVGNTWKDYWGRASLAYKKQSFGWWFAYPWATIKGTVNSALRYAFGLTGSIAVVSYGTVLRPAFEISLPVLKIGGQTAIGTAYATYGVLETSWGLGVNQIVLGTATPVCGTVWTTVLGVPMCLLGKAPTIKSADGWWVSLVEDRYSENTRPQQPDSAEIIRLIDWNMRYIRYSHAIEALKNNQEKEIDSINSILQSIRTRHRKEKDSVYTVFFHNSALALPVRKDAVVWTQEERAALVKTVRKYIDERLNDSIPDHEKNKMADYIVSNWIQKTVGTKYPVVNSKMDPNKVLQDEVKEIFNNP
jgi:hypothetical protein